MASEDVNEAPAWLTDDKPSTPASAALAAPALTATAAAPAAAVNTAPAAAPANPEDLAAAEQEQLRGVIMFMRLINLGVSVALVARSVLLFATIVIDPKVWVLTAFSMFGGCLICCLETQLKAIRTLIAVNFGFLFDPTLRFFFYLLLASICLSLKDLFGMIMAGCLVGVAVYNTFVLCRYPAYRKLRDELASEEDERINKKLRQEVGKEARRQMFTKS